MIKAGPGHFDFLSGYLRPSSKPANHDFVVLPAKTGLPERRGLGSVTLSCPLAPRTATEMTREL
jgi:hypothetical protein